MEKVFLIVLLDKFPLYAPNEGDVETPPTITNFVDVVVTNKIEHAHDIACKHIRITRDLDTNNLAYESDTGIAEVKMYNTSNASDFYRVFFGHKDHNDKPTEVSSKLERIIKRIPQLFKRNK